MKILQHAKRLSAILLVSCMALQLTACSQRHRRPTNPASSDTTTAESTSRRRKTAMPTGDLDSGDKISRRRSAAAKDASSNRSGRRQGNSDDLQSRRRRPSATSAPETPTPAPNSLPLSPTVVPSPSPAFVPTPEPVSALYNQMVEGMRTAEYPVHLNCTYEEFLDVYEILLDRPEIFWIRGYSANYTDTEVDVYFLYTHETEQEIQDAQAKIDLATAECMAGIPSGASEYEKALHIHDWLVKRITYVSDGGWHDQTLYGALVLNQCVCAGFSQAFTYLCRQAGLDAYSIIGYASSDVVTTANNPSNHAWNALTIDGSTSYVDTTWDNMDQNSASGDEYISHAWFGLDRDEMLLTHVPENSDDLLPTNTDRYSYFAEAGYQLDTFDHSQALALYNQQLAEGETMLELKFSTEEAYQAAIQDSYKLMAEIGISSSSINDVLKVLSLWK